MRIGRLLVCFGLCFCLSGISSATEYPDFYVPLPDEPNKVVVAFREALRNEDWDRALSFCSEGVKYAAEHRASTGEFFHSVFPIRECLAAPEFRVGPRSDKAIGLPVTYQLAIEIPQEYPLTLELYEGRWELGFPVLPLDAWKESMNREAGNDLLEREEWSIRTQPLKAQLKSCSVEIESPSGSVFQVGEPIRLRVSLFNRTDSPLWLAPDDFKWNDRLDIENSSGEKVPYTFGPVQTAIGWNVKEIHPGGRFVLCDGIDPTATYDLGKPGKYRVRYKKRLGWFLSDPIQQPNGVDNLSGASSFSVPSNTLEIEIVSKD